MSHEVAGNRPQGLLRAIHKLPFSFAACCLLLPVIFSAALWADEKAPKLLIEPGGLESQLGQKRLRLVDARSKDDFSKAHIPGATWVDVSGWKTLGKSPGGFQNTQAWSENIRKLGIDHDSQVVVYGSKLSDTARIWWLLKYLGLQQVVILDGGWDAWAHQKRPSSTAVVRVAPSRFVPKFQADRLETIDTLKKSVSEGKVTVVDTRSDDEFTGKDVRGKRGGHIPGAAHLEWKELLAADGRFKSPKQLRELFAEHGIVPTETAVCY